ncbi:MAG: aspartate--tRNA(Asn) ligase [Candidatus Moranbacteria bacterium]|nr:aspartate--tRNA(Asn) ligase [Candidatus Moranbacteria bacterium]
MESKKRTLIRETPDCMGETVRLQGWVDIRRDHGKLVFIDLRDRTGEVQLIILPDNPGAIEAAKDVRSEFLIEVDGLVKERPAKMQNDAVKTGGVEIEVVELRIIAKPETELPIDVSQTDLGVNLDTLLNNRTIALRNVKVRAVFSIYSEVLRSYDEAMRAGEFVEIKTPKILGSATEGGANFFKIKYFDRDAFLAQSPQFYKQAGMSAFERVFEIGTVFRAEPHFTTRHVNEYTGLDAEMGFIDGVTDVMDELERTMKHIFRNVGISCEAELSLYGEAVPGDVEIPRIRLSDAEDILRKEYGKELENHDIDSEGERMICEYVKKEYGSDLVFLTHYPTSLRPFYSMPSPDDALTTETFDLLFRGVEIASGGQRIHDAEMLTGNIRKFGLDPSDFSDYIDIFRYGAPPHGGWGLGSERIVQKMLTLGSIKEAVLYPRDVKRLAP